MNNLKNPILFILLIPIIICSLAGGCASYNSIVQLDEQMQSSWGQVENQYQRRADLIPNLVATVKGYASHEQETLNKVIEARAKATSFNVSLDNIDEETLAKYQQNQSELSSALGRLLVVSEQYPELKASEQFTNLQHQLEGTENRVSIARQDFNQIAQKYNTEIRTFPSNIVAFIGGFKRKPYFKALDGNDEAPRVIF